MPWLISSGRGVAIPQRVDPRWTLTIDETAEPVDERVFIEGVVRYLLACYDAGQEIMHKQEETTPLVEALVKAVAKWQRAADSGGKVKRAQADTKRAIVALITKISGGPPDDDVVENIVRNVGAG